MANISDIELDGVKLMSSVTVTVKITNNPRVQFGLLLFRLASWLSGVKLEVETGE